jgi:hypothetical protein
MGVFRGPSLFVTSQTRFARMSSGDRTDSIRAAGDCRFGHLVIGSSGKLSGFAWGLKATASNPDNRENKKDGSRCLRGRITRILYSFLKTYAPIYFYHIAEQSNLDSIKRHGLLSTEQLLKLTGFKKNESADFLGQHRPRSLVLANGITIRDQRPMPPTLLSPALLDGMTPPDWYRLLNGFVFLWANKERVKRHLRAFDNHRQALLVFNAPHLLADLEKKIYVSPINSGNARRRPVPRSQTLFAPYGAWRKSGWPLLGGRSRPSNDLPAEIVVKGHLPLHPYLVAIENC